MVKLDDFDRGVSGYLQTLRMKRSERLTLTEKHSRFEVLPVDDGTRKGVEIKTLLRDPTTGNVTTATFFETEHKAEEVTKPAIAEQAEDNPRENEPLRLDLKDSRTVIETNKMKISDQEVRGLVETALEGYYVVSKNDWIHKYSHVAGMDATGVIEWPISKPPVTWKWALRPGGLAVLTKPDGSAIFLAREKQ